MFTRNCVKASLTLKGRYQWPGAPSQELEAGSLACLDIDAVGCTPRRARQVDHIAAFQSQPAELRWYHDYKRDHTDILRFERKQVIRARVDFELRLAARPESEPVGGVV